MKTLVFCIGLGVLLFASSARAQNPPPNFIFSSFQCDPLSCDNRSLPTVEGTVFATFDSTCTGGAVGGIQAEMTTIIGIDPVTGQPSPCHVPLVARAAFEVFRTEELDDFCEPFLLDTVRQISEVLGPLGVFLWHKELSASCDGGGTGVFVAGTRPC
jgi:hypothetical protein